MNVKQTGRLFLAGVFLLGLFSCAQKKIRISSIQCENKVDPEGVNVRNLNFSWKMVSEERNQTQSAYQVVIASNEDKLKAGRFDIWDSGKTESDNSIRVKYTGPALNSGNQYFWKVKVWDKDGKASDWSKTGKLITGLVAEKDWSGAQWIGYDELDPSKRIVPGIHAPNHSKEWKRKKSGDHLLPLLRKEFNISKPLKSAFAFISGLGHYEMDLNGQKVGDRFLAPGWTNYDAYCFYNTYDITDQLSEGHNAIGVWLGNGFFIVPNERYRKLITAFGNPKMICKIQLNYKDGSTETVVSNETWKTHASPVTFSSIYAGEDYNATLEQDGWNLPGFDDKEWRNAVIVDAPNHSLVAEMDYPVTLKETLEVKSITQTDEEGEVYLYDFGQNASGIIELTVQGNKGDTVKLVPAELVNESQKAIQGATGKPYYFTYVLKGEGRETWRPRFTYYGFRYVQVEGAKPSAEVAAEGLPQVVELKFLHNRNSAPETGSFHTSFELFNRVNSLIKWAIKSNLQSVATDCPHREKLGWMEQTYLMGGGIHYNFDIYHLYCKMIEDMMKAQTEEGLVPAIAPEYTVFDFVGGVFRDSPEWGSASVILPWLIYKWYGDEQQMEKAWPMMTRYVDYLKGKSENQILDYGLGDWYDLGPGSPGFAQLTPIALTATAIYYYDVKLMCQMAEILGKTDDVQRYSVWANEIKKAFNDQFFDPETNIYSTGSQTAISMPLVLGLVDENKKEEVFQTLIHSINESGKALTAGDVGFHFLVKALQDGGAGDLLFEMNARDDVPGYGYQLKKGATALTESWQALERVSNNHLMLGHIMEWFYGGLGGIDQTSNSVAYKEIQIKPQFADDIEETNASFETPYGTVRSQWVRQKELITQEVEIPVNSSAIVYLPAKKNQAITENGRPVGEAPGVTIIGPKEDYYRVKVGSGNYHFEIH